ncbi:hypothetical protein K435DRAFT_974296 [Dendrothele bispora CBS 962.96]|uniref:C2H2-type domain-containing protein n=1 Tax=Dendrothele bispora (strain CBS 962.96) TaxID=1314807 RepID=A0A4S8KMH6_DENBC|nr:hypothetical protein K435DRAFT_974296 [Dendrothele bispora CBS 962.96]
MNCIQPSLPVPSTTPAEFSETQELHTSSVVHAQVLLQDIASERVDAHTHSLRRDVPDSTRSLICSICKKLFTAGHNLKYHLWAHFALKPFHCQEPGCIYSSTTPHTLTRHILTKHNKRVGRPRPDFSGLPDWVNDNLSTQNRKAGEYFDATRRSPRGHVPQENQEDQEEFREYQENHENREYQVTDGDTENTQKDQEDQEDQEEYREYQENQENQEYQVTDGDTENTHNTVGSIGLDVYQPNAETLNGAPGIISGRYTREDNRRIDRNFEHVGTYHAEIVNNNGNLKAFFAGGILTGGGFYASHTTAQVEVVHTYHLEPDHTYHIEPALPRNNALALIYPRSMGQVPSFVLTFMMVPTMMRNLFSFIRHTVFGRA